eukprot:326097_1
MVDPAWLKHYDVWNIITSPEHVIDDYIHQIRDPCDFECNVECISGYRISFNFYNHKILFIDLMNKQSIPSTILIPPLICLWPNASCNDTPCATFQQEGNIHFRNNVGSINAIVNLFDIIPSTLLHKHQKGHELLIFGNVRESESGSNLSIP